MMISHQQKLFYQFYSKQSLEINSQTGEEKYVQYVAFKCGVNLYCKSKVNFICLSN